MALQVIELTRDANVPIDKIAKLVQNDPALTTRILRTINSSYYGLTTPCPTISRAVSLLGINTVKSLVLGFSLVDMTGDAGRKGFDLTAYWRRTIYSAAGARLLAKRTRRCDPEEAFIGGLLQDVGMLAAHSALGEEYVRVLESAPEDHDLLAGKEHEAAGFDHASVGAALMERWKLPPQVVECTRRHHQPDHAAPAYNGLVRLVALGADAAAAMSLSDPKPKLARFRSRAKAWFDVPTDELDGLIREIADGAAQLSTLLKTQTGDRPDIAGLLAEANELLTIHQIEVEHEANELQAHNRELERRATTDALTGVGNRKHFDDQIGRAFGAASGQPLAVLFVDADRFKSVNDTLGHQAGDAVLVEIATRVRTAIGDRGTVCRYGGEEFAIIVPGANAADAERLGEALRAAVAASPIDISKLSLDQQTVPATVSVGVAATDVGKYDEAGKLVHAADEAVYIAKRAGRNCVRRATAPGEAPLARQQPREPQGGKREVLAVEDDALAAKLLELLFSRRADMSVRTVRTAEEALAALQAGLRPHVLLCDGGLPGMSAKDFISKLRTSAEWRTIPVLAIAGESDSAQAMMAAGATKFASKQEFCSDFAKWVQVVAELAAKAA